MEDISTISMIISELGIAVVVAGVVIAFLWYYRNDIRGLFLSIQERNKNIVQIEGERNELTRNNTAALDNNTAALGLVMSDREAMLRALDQHEKSSQERDLRNEKQNEDIKACLGKARGDIGELKVIVKERLK